MILPSSEAAFARNATSGSTPLGADAGTDDDAGGGDTGNTAGDADGGGAGAGGTANPEPMEKPRATTATTTTTTRNSALAHIPTPTIFRPFDFIVFEAICVRVQQEG
jgi:hypothetical protein